MKKINRWLIFLLCVPTVAFAQQNSLLQKYRSMALDYNHDLKAADKNIAASIELEKAAQKDLRPKLSGEANFQYTGNPLQLNIDLLSMQTPLAFEGRNMKYGASLSDADILPNALSLQEKQTLRRKLGIKEPKMILAVGQFIHRKGFDVLMEAAKDMDKNIGIYIVGGKPTEEYLELQRKFNLTQVHFEGFKTKDELADYFKAADLFVHPTREDIWGLVINEAMAYGLPVVTTNKCVAGMELIADKDCLIDTDSPEQLKAIMDKLMADDERRADIATHNLSKITNYTVEKMAEAHIKVFENL